MECVTNAFVELVDELVSYAQDDDELAAGIRWLDAQSQARGITFYEMVFEVLYRNDIDERARSWINTRN